MGIVSPSHHLVDVRNEAVLSFGPDGMAPLHETVDAAVAYVRLLPGTESPAHANAEAEACGLVLSGTLTYVAGMGQDLTVPQNGWVVAHPGEWHGYGNRGDRPLTMILFRPVAATFMRKSRSRVLPPPGEPRPRRVVYETGTSRGEVVALRPGENVSLSAARYAAVYCLDGRVMCLMKGDKLALESGEGVCLMHRAADLVGASGHSAAAVFSTLY